MLIKDASLPPDVLAVIRHQATERPHTGIYNSAMQSGSYLCRGCGTTLFRATEKFHAGCGWPSFDDAIPQTVLEQLDSDQKRTEIVCATCHAHLGHVFYGEGFTAKNRRHCVNSKSLDFVTDREVCYTEEAILAAGCFWGVEYYLAKLPGVVGTEVGYTGGHLNEPIYDMVCSGATGHYEAIRVLYDPEQVSYEALLKYFFEIHDPTQTDGQGPDLGDQYLSAIFYYDSVQSKIADDLIKILQTQHINVATRLLPVTTFWAAETYHQHYYAKTQHQPYCHRYIKRF